MLSQSVPKPDPGWPATSRTLLCCHQHLQPPAAQRYCRVSNNCPASAKKVAIWWWQLLDRLSKHFIINCRLFQVQAGQKYHAHSYVVRKHRLVLCTDTTESAADNAAVVTDWPYAADCYWPQKAILVQLLGGYPNMLSQSVPLPGPGWPMSGSMPLPLPGLGR